MVKIATALRQIKPSPTLSVTQRAQELKSQGVDILSFSAGEPDFDTPLHIRDAAKAALDRGMTRYTATAGIPELRRAVAEESARARGVPCTANRVIVTAGAKHAIYLFLQAVLEPGDEVIIPAPYWVSYPDQTLLVGGKPVIAETTAETGFTLSAEAFRRACTKRTKVLVINTPSNPTGELYPREELAELVLAAVEAGVYVLADEIYRDLVYDGAAHASPLAVVPEDMRDLVFVVDGVSKTYAMTGWRIGWGIGHPDIVGAMTTIQGQATSNATAMAQAAALAAVTGPKGFLAEWTAEYRARRDTMHRRLTAIPGVTCRLPRGAFYLLPSVAPVLARMGADATDVALSTLLLEKARVAVVPGSAFGAPGHVRLSYATSLKAIEAGMDRMAEALGRL